MTQLYNEYHANRVAIALQMSEKGSHNPDDVRDILKSARKS